MTHLVTTPCPVQIKHSSTRRHSFIVASQLRVCLFSVEHTTHKGPCREIVSNHDISHSLTTQPILVQGGAFQPDVGWLLCTNAVLIEVTVNSRSPGIFLHLALTIQKIVWDVNYAYTHTLCIVQPLIITNGNWSYWLCFIQSPFL